MTDELAIPAIILTFCALPILLWLPLAVRAVVRWVRGGYLL